MMQPDIVEKFSTHLKNVLTRALLLAMELKQTHIYPEHLLWALGTEEGAIGCQILRKAKVKSESLRRLVLELKPSIPPMTRDIASTLELTDDARRCLEKAVVCAHGEGHRYVGTEHLLSGLIHSGGKTVSDFFLKERTDVAFIRDQLTLVLKSVAKFGELAETISKPSPKGTEAAAEQTRKLSAIDYFAIELTSQAWLAKLDPVIGREAEIERVTEILCRRQKNNPLLIGEPGVGKTAIIEGLAKRIAEGTAPSALIGRRVFALDLGQVVAGTMYRGEFEARIKQIIEEARQNPDIILFIDEIHTMVGAGGTSGSLDAANMFKPALARGDVRLIGATTPDEFKKHIETDAALERRLQVVQIREPSAEETQSILKGLQPQYERFHGVTFGEGTIGKAVEWADQFLPSKRFPDKAIDILDETAASARARHPASASATQEQTLASRLRTLEDEKSKAVQAERFDEAVHLKEEQDMLTIELRTLRSQDRPRETLAIGMEDIARMVGKLSGIPAPDILQSSFSSASSLATKLETHVVGQTDALARTAAAVSRGQSGWSDRRRPLASLLFLGPSGVGKTETAKAIAREVFHDEKAFIRLDMSEFSEGFTASKLIGAPAGYVGYRDSARLTDAVKARPHCVVLFDEIEKAHPDVQQLLLPLLEEGELTDGTGRTVNFRHTYVILTSNAGLERFERGPVGFASPFQQKPIGFADIKEEVEQRFRKELLNRLDDIIVFRPLTDEHRRAIAERRLNELMERLSKKSLAFRFDEKLLAHLSSKADAALGARDLHRVIRREVEAPLLEQLSQRAGTTKAHVQLKKGAIAIQLT
ncbi:ATP-dependent Clp protease ATP-binding subunit [Candidatus Uhrbacteria bacterium]|nr:ATP-dependent Clp protease ATP-binding subunit [Candidatus Uhrbacteria bacterium]